MNKRIKWIGGLVIILVVIILIASQQSGQTNITGPIKIGAILPLTGDYAVLGQEIQKGIDIAVDEVNSQGGINNRKMEIIYEDGGMADFPKITSAAHKLIDVDKVYTVLVDSLTTMKPIAPLFQQNKIPAIMIFDNAELGSYIFSIGFSTQKTGEKMADFVYSKKNIKEVAIVAQLDEVMQTLSKAFKDKFEKLGGKVTILENINPSENDFKTTITKIKNSKPQGIYFSFVQGIDLFLKQIKEQKLNLPIFGNDAVTEDVIAAAGSAAEGVYFANFYTNDNPILKSLTEKYKEKYNEEPQLLLFNAFGYDGVLVLKEAIKNIKIVSPQNITESLYKIKNLDTSSGETISISPVGTVERTEKIFQIQNGKGISAE